MNSYATSIGRSLLALLAAGLWAAPAHAQLTVAGGSLTVLPSTTLNVGGDVQVLAPATLDNQGTLQLTGNLSSAGTIGTGTGLWQLTGTSLQTLSSTGTGGPATLEVNNPAGATLGAPLTIGSLTFTSGMLRLGAYDLTLRGTTSGAAASRFVATNGAGTLRQPVGAGSTFFPVGPADGRYSPATLVRSSGTAIYGVGVGPEALASGPSGVPYPKDAVALHWTIIPPDATPYDLTLQWSAADELPSFSRATSAVARWNGSAYVPTAFGAATGTDPYQRSSAGLAAGGSFVVLDQQVPLPVELTRFEAQRPPGQTRVLLSWATASELNNAGFEIERRDEGQTTFRRVGFVSGQGSSTLAHSYTFTDPNDLATFSYYRLRQLDLNGEATYSPVRAVAGLPEGTSFSLAVYPNPAHSAATLETSGRVPTGLQLHLYSADGRLVWAAAWDGPRTTMPLPVAGLAEGSYWLRWQTPAGATGTLPVQVQP